MRGDLVLVEDIEEWSTDDRRPVDAYLDWIGSDGWEWAPRLAVEVWGVMPGD